MKSKQKTKLKWLTPSPYVAGATWTDVMSGKPVLIGEKRSKSNLPARNGECRKCGHTGVIAGRSYAKGRVPRCFKCGGAMRLSTAV